MCESEESIRTKTKEFIVSVFFLDAAGIKIEKETSFLDSRIIDSTGIMEVVNYLQEEYAIQIEDDEMRPQNLDSLKNIGAFIYRKLATRTDALRALPSSLCENK